MSNPQTVPTVVNSALKSGVRVRHSNITAQAQAGFTLLEMLIALTVLTLAIAAATQIVTSSARSLYKTAQSQRALEYGFNHLAELSQSSSLSAGNYVGAYQNGFEWTLRVTSKDTPDSAKQTADLEQQTAIIEALQLDLLVVYETGQQRFHDLVLRQPNRATDSR